jgi:D-lactate dehydrogenase
MAIKMLVFDYRKSEKNFFKSRNLENFEIVFHKESLNEDTVKLLSQEELQTALVISVFINSEITENVINAFKNLRIISSRSTGIDHINIKYAETKNIAVTNVEGYGSRSVAQYTIGLMIALIRHIVFASKHISKGEHRCTAYVGRDISKLTIGIVGTGAIGISVCKLAKALDMNILAYDINKKQELIDTTGAEYVDLETLIKNSDVISLHIPYTGNNRHMFSLEQFRQMKNSAYLINTSRGELVNTKDLYEAISKGIINGAALDVVTCEDASFRCSEFERNAHIDLECYEESMIIKELVQLPNVIITPHIAYETQDAIDYILDISINGILDCIKGGYKYRVC